MFPFSRRGNRGRKKLQGCGNPPRSKADTRFPLGRTDLPLGKPRQAGRLWLSLPGLWVPGSTKQSQDRSPFSDRLLFLSPALCSCVWWPWFSVYQTHTLGGICLLLWLFQARICHPSPSRSSTKGTLSLGRRLAGSKQRSAEHSSGCGATAAERDQCTPSQCAVLAAGYKKGQRTCGGNPTALAVYIFIARSTLEALHQSWDPLGPNALASRRASTREGAPLSSRGLTPGQVCLELQARSVALKSKVIIDGASLNPTNLLSNYVSLVWVLIKVFRDLGPVLFVGLPPSSPPPRLPGDGTSKHETAKPRQKPRTPRPWAIDPSAAQANGRWSNQTLGASRGQAYKSLWARPGLQVAPTKAAGGLQCELPGRGSQQSFNDSLGLDTTLWGVEGRKCRKQGQEAAICAVCVVGRAEGFLAPERQGARF